MKKLCFFLALVFSFSISTGVFAEKPSDTVRHFIVVESHKQITDKSELVQLALQQKSRADKSKSLNSKQLLGRGNKSKSFNSKQLLEKRKYDDGTIEEEYVPNSVAVLDDNNVQVDASAVVAATATTYTYADGTKTTSNSTGSGPVAFVQTLSYTERYSNPLGLDMVFRVNEVTTVIAQQTGTCYCTNFQHGYHILNDVNDYMNSAYVNYPTAGIAYTVDSNHSGFYPKSGGVWNSIFSFYHVEINDGSTTKSIEGSNNL